MQLKKLIDDLKLILRILKTDYLDSEEYERLWEIITSGQEWKGQFYNQTKAGNYYWEQASISPVTNSQGEIINFIKVAKDITTRKQQEEKLEENLAKAKQIHRSLLPQLPQQKDLATAVFYQPADNLGGDFYNFYQVGDKLVVYLADVSGHGLDGAMVNILVRENLNNYIADVSDEEAEFSSKLRPREMLARIYEVYTKEAFPADYFLCIQLARIDFADWKVKYSNAGSHILPLLISPTGEIKSVPARGVPIFSALKFTEQEVKEESFTLAPAEKLFLATDGLIEAENEARMYGRQRLRQVVEANYYLDCELIKERVLLDFERFLDTEVNKQDDITFLILAREPENKLQLTLDSNFAQLDSVEDKLVTFLPEKLDNQRLIILGVHELLANAVEHGNQFADDKQVVFEAVKTETYVRFAVEDEGEGFDWVQHLEAKVSYSNLAERGRGISIACKVFDRLKYNRRGNRVNMIKFLGTEEGKNEKDL